MFDTIAGLPLHPLVVHAVVVLVPLGAVLTMAVAVRPAWRALTPWVVALDAAMVVASFVAVKTGEAFQTRLSGIRGGAAVAASHASQGRLVPWVAIAVLVGGILVLLAGSRAALRIPAIAVAVIAGVTALAWVVVVGHSGATDVWGYVTQTASSGS